MDRKKTAVGQIRRTVHGRRSAQTRRQARGAGAGLGGAHYAALKPGQATGASAAQQAPEPIMPAWKPSGLKTS